MFITALFTIASIWMQPRCPSVAKWIRKLWYIYTIEYYSAVKKNALESTLKVKIIISSVLSFLYSSTLTSIHDNWETIALTRWTFVSQVMSLLFNMLSRLVISFLPRSKRLLVSWLQSPSAVIVEKILGSSFTFSSIILIVEHLHIHFLILPQHEIILQRRYYDYPCFTEGKTDSERFSHFLSITQLVGGGARTRTQVQTPELYCHLNCLSLAHKQWP